MAAKRKKSTSSSSRSKAKQADAIGLLKADHAEVEKMHKRFKKLVKEDAGAAEREQLAQDICSALTKHAAIEEEIFYPALREALEDDAIVDHADVEHASAKNLIAQIQGMGADDSHFNATVLVLCEYVAHHVEEEEGKMFPKAKKADLDLAALGDELRERKDELPDMAQPGRARRSNGARSRAP